MRLGLGIGALAATLTCATWATQPITPGGAPVAGTLEPSDLEAYAGQASRNTPEYFRDIYSFRGERDETVEITVNANDFDCYLILIQPGGMVLAENDDHGSTRVSYLQVALPMNGDYLAIVTSYSSGSGGSYTITVSDPQDPPEASEDANISIGRTVQGELTPDDNAALPGDSRGVSGYYRDGYAFRAREGDAVLIDLACSFDGYLFLLDPNNQIIARNDDFHSVNSSRINATLGQSGRHRIVVSSFSQNNGGVYALTLAESTGEEDPMANGQPVFTPQMVMMTQPTPDSFNPRMYHPGFIEAQPQRGSSDSGTVANQQPLEMLIEPLNISCTVGDRFLTSVRLSRTAVSPFDEVSIALRWDPQLLRPLRVSDHKLRPLLEDDPTLEFDLQAGMIRYTASLARPHKELHFELLTIEWEAVAPALRTRIAPAPGGEDISAVRLGVRDVLGDAGDPSDGMVGCDIAIARVGEEGLIGSLLVDHPQGIEALHGVNPLGDATLRLVGPGDQIRVGDEIWVDVVLENPKATPFDALRFAIELDPDIFEVLDAAHSGDADSAGNWIVRGVNLLDAPFHDAFPFDLHFVNEANPRSGRISYHMGQSRAHPLAGGTVARIRLRALAPAEATELRFMTNETSLTCQGQDALGNIEDPADGLAGLTLRTFR